MATAQVRLISAEFKSVDLGDTRLNRRVMKLADDLALAPDVGLPRACKTNAALEAAYRLLSNSRVTPEGILAPHVATTVERMRGDTPVLIVHDTTEFAFNGEGRKHVGRTNSGQPGFFAHVSLGIRLDDREPMGVLGFQTWARKDAPKTKVERRQASYYEPLDKESQRWCTGIDAVEECCHGVAPLVHVADREGDQYRLMCNVVDHRSSFVVRAKHDRNLANGDGTIWSALPTTTTVFVRDVKLSRRRPKHGIATHGAREARPARLSVSATKVDLKRNRQPVNAGLPKVLHVNVVWVAELEPPAGEDPVDWVLLTNLPVDTADQIAVVVDCYRARWMVEELFKAVKTGCAYEKLQLETEQSLRNALALILPIAWQMLLLRKLAQSSAARKAHEVLTPTQLEILAHNPWVKVSKKATAKEALWAIASIGGHIRNNGEPGWRTLYAGMRDLALLEIGWRARCGEM